MRSDPHHVASIAYGLKTGLRILIVSDFEQTLDCHHYHHCKATKLAGCEAGPELHQREFLLSNKAPSVRAQAKVNQLGDSHRLRMQASSTEWPFCVMRGRRMPRAACSSVTNCRSTSVLSSVRLVRCVPSRNKCCQFMRTQHPELPKPSIFVTPSKRYPGPIQPSSARKH
jgi:hypothetical protein